MLRTKKGFTLLELIVVLIVLAILALIAIPSYNAVMDKAAAQAALVSAQATARDANALAAFDDASTTDVQLKTVEGELSGGTGFTSTFVDATSDTPGPDSDVTDGYIDITVAKGGRTGTANVALSGGLAVASAGSGA